MPSEFEGSLLSWVSPGFSFPHPLPIQQLKSSHHGFVGQMGTKSPQTYLSRVPLLLWHQTSLQSASLGKTLLPKMCPVALSHLKQCHSQKDKLKMLADSRQLRQGQYQKLSSQTETITERFAGTDVEGKINLNSSLGSEI